MPDATPLPRFARPPVVETILGLFFRPIAKLSDVDLSVYWDRQLRAAFPAIERRPPVEPVIERFDGSRLTTPHRLEFGSLPQPTRMWLQSPDGEHVVQLQSDSLLTNWLRSSDGTAYLSYEQRRASFADRLSEFSDFIQEQTGETIRPVSALVTYINHFPIESGRNAADDFNKIFDFWKNNPADGWLPAPDALKLEGSYPFEAEQGRLHLTMVPAISTNNRRPIWRMELVARANCDEAERCADALARIDLCHEWVVRGFASLTTARMHSRWGRTE